MALHLNLNHELERVRAQRRRDPLKLTMLGLVIVAAGFVAQYFWTMTKTSLVMRDRDAKRADFARLEPLGKAAVVEEAELKKKLGNSDRFLKRIEGRFYWAPLIQEIVQIVPPYIHITRLAGDATGEDSKKVQANIEGIVAGTEPRTTAESFRHNIQTTMEKKYRNVIATFRHLEDGTDTIQIEGKSVPTASFAINLQFQCGDAAAPAVTAKKP